MQRLAVRTAAPVKVNALAAVGVHAGARTRRRDRVPLLLFVRAAARVLPPVNQPYHGSKSPQDVPCGGWASNFPSRSGMMRGCFCTLRLRGGQFGKKNAISLPNCLLVRPGELSIVGCFFLLLFFCFLLLRRECSDCCRCPGLDCFCKYSIRVSLRGVS